MTEQLHETDERSVQDTETETLIRQIEEVLRAYNPEVIRIAAEMGMQLPHMGVVNGELVERHSRREQILQRLGDFGIR